MQIQARMPATFDGNTVTVVPTLSTGTVAVVVDAVSDALELKPAEIQQVPALNDSADARLFHRLGCTSHADEERTLIVMHLQSLVPHGTASQ